jgi:NhaP-type Na+/H+ or K+/H+ antiporter
MMGVSLLFLGLMFFVAHFLVLLFRRTKIPDVFFLILLGFVAGPVLGFVNLKDFGVVGNVLSTFALVLLLFEGGTHLSPATLSQALKGTLGLALSTFFLTVAIAASVGVFFMGLTLMGALTLGTILGGISPAVVIPLAKYLGLSDNNQTSVILESALTDVLSIILTFSLINLGVGGHFEIGPMLGQLLSAFLFAVIIGLLGSLVWILVLNSIRGIPNTVFSTLAFGLVLYGLTEFLGFSGAFAALAFGFGLTNQVELGFHRLPLVKKGNPATLTTIELSFFSEVTFLLKTFFFFFLGLSFQWTDLQSFPYILIFLGALFTFRPFLAGFFLKSKTEKREGALISILVPKGLASAVLAGIPLARGMVDGATIQSFTVTAVILSVVFTSVLVLLVEKTSLVRFYALFFPRQGTETPAKAETPKIDP